MPFLERLQELKQKNDALLLETIANLVQTFDARITYITNTSEIKEDKFLALIVLNSDNTKQIKTFTKLNGNFCHPEETQAFLIQSSS